MTAVFTFQRGTTPILVSVPHAGTCILPAISKGMRWVGRQLEDTDWFVDRLYAWVADLGAGLLVANYSRYVIDLNRPANDDSLYDSPVPGLVPQNSFNGEPLYREGMQPGQSEIALRLEGFWRPYHLKLAEELDDLKKRYGYAILLDAHSIRSKVPLFEGRLPDLNLGTFNGNSAHPCLIAKAYQALQNDPARTTVLDGRFQGGYITRHYGQPHSGIHALQLEMAQSVYMREQSREYDQERASTVVPVLQHFLNALLQWAPTDE